MTHGRGRHGRRYYLQDVPLDEAKALYWNALDDVQALRRTGTENIPIQDALGRIAAVPVWAARSVPHYDSAAMDGVAVHSRDTTGATETAPLKLTLPDQARWVDTGEPVPDGFDAVIMVEVVHEIDDSTIEITAPVPPYNHVRPIGEDIVASELLLPENHKLRPVDLGACAAAGVTTVDVRLRPTVAIIPTGTELVEIDTEPGPGDIVEFNSLVLGGMLRDWGAEPVRYAPVSDEPKALARAISAAVDQHDIVLVNAGSSAGAEDYTAALVEELGSLVVHGVAIRPGHPIVLGVIDDKAVIGIPGYPVSAAIACELFVQPLVEAMLGHRVDTRPTAKAVVTRRIQSPMGEDEFLRVRLGQVGNRLVATPVQRGAGVISSLVRADGLTLIPRAVEGLDAGSEVEVQLLKPMREVRNTVVAIGSHDMVLDLMASRLSRIAGAPGLTSANVGSLGGLLAIRRGEAHVAGTHLLDEETGEYNVSFIERYIPNREVVLVHLADRTQGLMVKRGNPLGIASIEDLTRLDVSFVNRQRGSGTRVLLDFELSKSGIDAGQVTGYEREEYTHLAVAAAVQGDKADTGLGILPAARAMDLDFIPLFSEEYDLVIPSEFYESDLLHPMLELIRSPEFRVEVEALGGYQTENMGIPKTTIGGSQP